MEPVRKLAESFSNDALLRQRNAICFAMGNLKSTTLFGSRGKPLAENFSSPRRSPTPESLGVMGMTYTNLLKGLPEEAVCTVSLLEIADDETLWDMLSPHPTGSQSKLKPCNEKWTLRTKLGVAPASPRLEYQLSHLAAIEAQMEERSTEKERSDR